MDGKRLVCGNGMARAGRPDRRTIHHADRLGAKSLEAYLRAEFAAGPVDVGVCAQRRDREGRRGRLPDLRFTLCR